MAWWHWVITVGAGWLGLRSGYQVGRAVTIAEYETPLEGGAGPPLALPAPDQSAQPYAPAWAQVEHTVDVMPDGVGEALYSLPPPTVDGISVSPDCSIIAVGHGFWDRAGAHAEDLVKGGKLGANEIAVAVTNAFAPQCVGQTTAAANELREQLRARARDALGLPPAQPPPEQLHFAKNGRGPWTNRRMMIQKWSESVRPGFADALSAKAVAALRNPLGAVRNVHRLARRGVARPLRRSMRR